MNVYDRTVNNFMKGNGYWNKYILSLVRALFFLFSLLDSAMFLLPVVQFLQDIVWIIQSSTKSSSKELCELFYTVLAYIIDHTIIIVYWVSAPTFYSPAGPNFIALQIGDLLVSYISCKSCIGKSYLVIILSCSILCPRRSALYWCMKHAPCLHLWISRKSAVKLNTFLFPRWHKDILFSSYSNVQCIELHLFLFLSVLQFIQYVLQYNSLNICTII